MLWRRRKRKSSSPTGGEFCSAAFQSRASSFAAAWSPSSHGPPLFPLFLRKAAFLLLILPSESKKKWEAE